jgi:hypothetical protein
MKRKLLFVAFIALSCITGNAQVCTPAWNGGSSGINPDSAQGLPAAVADVPYAETINFKVPKDTFYDGYQFPIDSLVLEQVIGLPSSITYACNPSNCSFLGGTIGCGQLSGTPLITDTGAHHLKVIIVGYSGIVQLPDTVKYYTLNVNATSGISSLNRYYFDAGQNYPNPVKSTTQIYFNLPVSGNVQFKVYNLLGTIIYMQNYSSKSGTNSITFDAGNVADGMYFYSLSDGSNIITYRMIIDKK